MLEKLAEEIADVLKADAAFLVEFHVKHVKEGRFDTPGITASGNEVMFVIFDEYDKPHKIKLTVSKV
jgi:dihydroneopterin aldolase